MTPGLVRGISIGLRPLAPRARAQPRRAPRPKANDVAATFGRNSDGNYCGNRDDTTAVADLEVSRVKPQIGPFAVERAVEEGVCSLVDVLVQFRDLAL
jgi:hypothetical protein